MARRWHLSLLAVMCSAELQGLPDAVVLHQKRVAMPSKAVDADADTQGMVQPSKDHVADAQTMLAQVASTGIKQLSSSIGEKAYLRWPLTGLLTQKAMEIYQKPRTPAQMEFADGIVVLLGKAFGVSTESLDDRVVDRLMDRMQELIGHRDKTAGNLGLAGTLPREDETLMNEAIGKLRIQSVASLLRYASEVLTGGESFILDKLAVLLQAAMKDLGTPTPIKDYVNYHIENARHHIPFSIKELPAALVAVGKSSEELGLPKAFGKMFKNIGLYLSGKDHNSGISGLFHSVESAGVALKEAGMPEGAAKFISHSWMCVKPEWFGFNDTFDICVASALVNATVALGGSAAQQKFVEALGRVLTRGHEDEDGARERLLVAAQPLGIPLEAGDSLRTMMKKVGIPALAAIVMGMAPSFTPKNKEQKTSESMSLATFLVAGLDLPSDLQRLKRSRALGDLPDRFIASLNAAATNITRLTLRAFLDKSAAPSMSA